MIDDRWWDVVQTIASLSVADLTSDTQFTRFFPGSFHQVPITGPFDHGMDGEPGDTVTPELLARIVDFSIIRGVGTPDFYHYATFEPEG